MDLALPATSPPLIERYPLAPVFDDLMDWFARGECKVQDRDTGKLITLDLDSFTGPQWRIFEAATAQVRAGQPVRIAIPKFRRGGVSTLIQAIAYRICRRWPLMQALTVAHSLPATKNIFRTTLRIRNHDGKPGKASASGITFTDHGDGFESVYEVATGGAKGVARGSGYAVLHLSELAALQSQSGLDADAVAALLNVVADSAATMVFIESTGQGPAGEFYRICQQAALGQGRYKLVFLGWNEDKRNIIQQAAWQPAA